MAIFSFLNKKLRCPNCGCKDNHKKSTRNDVSKDVEGMIRELMANEPKDSLTYKSYSESLSKDFYSCTECTKVFSLSTAVTWKKISDKFGEKIAIDEYKNSSKS